MKQANTQIDVSNDEKKMLGKNLKLHFKVRGHYAIPIGR